MGQSVLTVAGYTRAEGALFCEGVSLDAIARRTGTPVYVYSAGVIRERYAALLTALDGAPVRIHYSVKANSNLTILGLLRSLGAGVDIVSGGELHRALEAGFGGREMVFSGVGKNADEMERALLAGVGTMNVESEGELRALQTIAERIGVVARVALRVNPNVAVGTPHPYTRTGEYGMKFGIPRDQILPLARLASIMANVNLRGLAAHLGSQIRDAAPFAAAGEVLVGLKRAIEAEGTARIETLDLGGGLGVTYGEEPEPDLMAYAEALRAISTTAGVEVIIEPGRFLVAEAGVLLTRVLYRKHSGGKEIVVADAGMNDFIRPSLYESHHAIEVVSGDDAGGADDLVVNVVGPVCESGDFFAKDRVLNGAMEGKLLAIRDAGAYGYSMASNYNSRRRAAEVLVDGGRFAVITERESDADLTRRETLTPEWIEA